MGQILVGRGGVDLVLTEGDIGLEARFVPDFDVYRWRGECEAIVVSPAVLLDYRCELPECTECDEYGLCTDMARDDHDTDGEISSRLAQAREQECVAVDLDRLLAAAGTHADALEAWATGEIS